MTVEEQETDTDSPDPADSPLLHFGREVQIERERIGMSRGALGKAAICSYSLVAKVEAGDRVPSRDFAEACDRVFPNSNGRFTRLWPLVLRYAYPPWFRRYVDLERKASKIRMFNPGLLPGLVQTPEYARAVLRTGRPSNLDDLVTARIERQHVLTRREPEPARLALVLNEVVLRNLVGSRETMRAQLLHLRNLAETPAHRVQIIKDKGAGHHGFHSPFGLLSFKEGADVVHVDGFPRGYLLAEPEDVANASDAYDLLTAMAEPPDESAEMIDSISKDCYS
ncbi:helix-turn-helix domain-containing protein [Streptomyces sp. NBC_00291]|uniref:helix-turn-helix domain-containing protein n=1 Tax=Streptomyces sp. NBC_00291 TaxID=2975704 RepID=UPI0022509FF7|nr:helix-turn-helix transcriptional regulator [Streptomyces sp. NBC_00291]MCX5153721.1 helix-turn-helix domain-containing protein [Streptomyces sp. NBC_00291]